MKSSYDSVIVHADTQANQWRKSIDSLQNLQLPTNGLTSKLDSMKQWKDENLQSITSKVYELMSGVAEKINNLELPHELKDKADELTSVMDKLDESIPKADPVYGLIWKG